MRLAPVIERLRARCPAFSQRVAGAARFQLLEESASLAVPFAFVIPLDDNPGEPISQNSVRQPLTESFAVIVALSNVADERGQASSEQLHDIRAEVCRALLGWQPTPKHDLVMFEGGALLRLDRARLWWQFEFAAETEIGPEDGSQQVDLDALPPLQGANLRLDVVDPAADPNVQYPGPDGRIEAGANIDLPS